MSEWTGWAIAYRKTDIDDTVRTGMWGIFILPEYRVMDSHPVVRTLLFPTRSEARAQARSMREAAAKWEEPNRRTISTPVKVRVTVEPVGGSA